MKFILYLQWIGPEDPPVHCPTGRYYFSDLYWLEMGMRYAPTWDIRRGKPFNKREADILVWIWSGLTYKGDAWRLVIEKI